MTQPSTISLLTAIQNGQELPKPVRPGKPKPQPKPAPVVTPETIAKRDDMRTKLQTGRWIIEFVKVDGTPSILEATLDPRLLPSSDPAVFGGAGRPEQLHLLHVFSIDRDGWRSFHVDSVTKFYQPVENL